jgi:adenylate cyclase
VSSAPRTFDEIPVIPGSTAARRRPITLGVVLGLIGLVTSLLPSSFRLEEGVGLGLLFAARGPLPPPTEVMVIGISRDAARAIGQTTELDTWSRDQHAQLVDRLVAGGASTIAFDLMFHERRPGNGDDAFAASIARAGNVVLLEETNSDVHALGGTEGWAESYTPPLPELDAVALGSAPFVLPTRPVSVGQFWTFGRASDDLPSLPVVTVQAHLLPHYEEFVQLLERVRPGTTAGWPRTGSAVKERRQLEETMTTVRRAFQADADLRVAAERELERGISSAAARRALSVLLDLYAGPSSRFLNLYGPARSVTTLPYDRALDDSSAGAVAGKALLVGLSEPRQPEQQDDFLSVFSQSTGENLSGAELGATAIANLLEQRTLAPLPLPLQSALLVALGVVFGVLVAPWTVARAATVGVLAGAAYFGIAYWQFSSANLWLPLLVPLLVQLPACFGTAVWWSYREVATQRERVRTALGYYVPQSLVRGLTEQTLSPGANRQVLHGTCLVTDAENYTTVAERLSAAQLATLVNDYYRAIFGVVQQHGGEISDTAGDSMVAVWASSRPDADARQRAVEASVAILRAVEDFNRTRADTPLPTRVGLESGEMVLGNIGAEQRYEYRAVGDIVNTASRIQGLNQRLGTRVLISAATLDGLSLPARDVGTFVLRGKRLPVQVFEPLTGDRCVLDREGLVEFTAALAALRRGAWAEARAGFTAVAKRFPGDGPTRYYTELSQAMCESPPANWTGAVHVTVK